MMFELQYAQTSGTRSILFYVTTFIGNRTKAEESLDYSHPLAGINCLIVHYIVQPPCKDVTKNCVTFGHLLNRNLETTNQGPTLS